MTRFKSRNQIYQRLLTNSNQTSKSYEQHEEEFFIRDGSFWISMFELKQLILAFPCQGWTLGMVFCEYFSLSSIFWYFDEALFFPQSLRYLFNLYNFDLMSLLICKSFSSRHFSFFLKHYVRILHFSLWFFFILDEYRFIQDFLHEVILILSFQV